MKHYTNKRTNKTYGYESLDEAKQFNDDFDNLVEMTDEQFNDFKYNRPKGGKWTYQGWVVDEDKLKEDLLLEQESHKQNLLKRIQELNLQIQEHLLMDEKEQAKELVLQKRGIQEEIINLESV